MAAQATAVAANVVATTRAARLGAPCGTAGRPSQLTALGMLGLVASDDHGEERRLLLPPARHRHPERDPGDAILGVPQLGVVGQVAGEADAGLGHGLPLPVAWPGGLP